MAGEVLYRARTAEQRRISQQRIVVQQEDISGMASDVDLGVASRLGDSVNSLLSPVRKALVRINTLHQTFSLSKVSSAIELGYRSQRIRRPTFA